jgi:hypothetical protein
VILHKKPIFWSSKLENSKKNNKNLENLEVIRFISLVFFSKNEIFHGNWMDQWVE